MLKEASKYSYIGIFFAIAICLGYFGGGWLDRKFHTEPYLGISGFIVGVAAGFKELWRLTRQYRKQNDRADD